MKRKAIIIYCSNTKSGKLNGPVKDNENFREHLTGNIGGNWYDHEVISMPNPTRQEVLDEIKRSQGCDYTFIVFTGHGAFEENARRQHMEVADGDITISDIKTTAPRQTIIIDACRGFFTEFKKSLQENKMFSMDSLLISRSTRKIFEDVIEAAPEGLTVLYAASENQTAMDTNNGAAYLISLIESATDWEKQRGSSVLDLKRAHEKAIEYLKENFEDTIQVPALNQEKRTVYFPFAVKLT
jgi:hypothetical protein